MPYTDHAQQLVCSVDSVMFPYSPQPGHKGTLGPQVPIHPPSIFAICQAIISLDKFGENVPPKIKGSTGGTGQGHSPFKPGDNCASSLSVSSRIFGIKKGGSGESCILRRSEDRPSSVVTHCSQRQPLLRGARCFLSSLAPACMCVC